MAAHSKIGASSMYRWSQCPGSVRLSEGIEAQESEYAKEGTRAHELAAKVLLGKGTLTPGDEMSDAVKLYVDIIREDEKRDPKTTRLVEHRFDLSAIHAGLFGTADAVLFSPKKKILRVYDYKHGAGISVEVENNLQLQYYALGALLTAGFNADTVETVIVQPRCQHPGGAVRRWSFPAVSLLDFAADLKDYALATEDKNAPLNPGPHCRFCPASGICPAAHSKALTLAKTEFSPTVSYDAEKLANILGWLPTLESWAKSVREFAYAEALRGRTPPGWKLVEKRAIRKWRDESQVAEVLAVRFKLDENALFERSLKSVAQVEKLLSSKSKDQLSDLVIKQSSGSALVEESDPREAVGRDATLDFKEISA